MSFDVEGVVSADHVEGASVVFRLEELLVTKKVKIRSRSGIGKRCDRERHEDGGGRDGAEEELEEEGRGGWMTS